MIKNKFYFEWIDLYMHNRTSDVFYCLGEGHSPVVYIEFNGRRTMISCDGEMSFYYGDTRIRSGFDLAKARIDSDAIWEQIRGCIDDGLFPWFDAYEWDQDGKYWNHLDMVSGDLNEIIFNVQHYLLFNEER